MACFHYKFGIKVRMVDVYYNLKIDSCWKLTDIGTKINSKHVMKMCEINCNEAWDKDVRDVCMHVRGVY